MSGLLEHKETERKIIGANDDNTLKYTDRQI